MKYQKTLPQLIFALFCLFIVIIRFFYPNLKFDSFSLNLIIISTACILIPDLAQLIARIKRIKIGDNEIELREEITYLQEMIQKLENRVFKAGHKEYKREFTSEPFLVDKYLLYPRAGLIAIAIDIETRIKKMALKHYPKEECDLISPIQLANKLAYRGIIDKEAPFLIKEFWHVRNKIIHGTCRKINAQEIYRVIDLGNRILELLSISKSKEQQQGVSL